MNGNYVKCVFKAAQNIKENLDVKYGPTWHVIVGEGFSFDITYEVNKSVDTAREFFDHILLYLFTKIFFYLKLIFYIFKVYLCLRFTNLLCLT